MQSIIPANRTLGTAARRAWLFRGPGSVVSAAAALAAFAAALGVIGADALWLVPLGERLAHGELPHAIPYAAAPTSGWRDVPAGAELVFWSLFHALGGARGLVVAQAVAAAAGFGFLARGLRLEASAGATLLASVIVLVGSLPNVVVTSIALFSLALYPLLLWLLESETRAPSRRIWLSVPLLALWGNLHGEVITGWGLLACYLVLARGRRAPWLSAAVLAGATAALFANPALWHTPRYYWAVLNSEPARKGTGLWAPLGAGGFDLVLVASAVILVAVGLIGGVRVHPWEAVALFGLAASTVQVARTGTWFLFLAAYPATRSLRMGDPRRRVVAVLTVMLGAAALALLVRGPPDPGSSSLAARAASTGRPVLAEAILGQQVALAGGRVWVDNPIDAFRRGDQSLYLAWLAGQPRGATALSHAGYVLVERRSIPGRLAAQDPRLSLVAASRGAVLYRVRPSTPDTERGRDAGTS
jgi:hypothetical protein